MLVRINRLVDTWYSSSDRHDSTVHAWILKSVSYVESIKGQIV